MPARPSELAVRPIDETTNQTAVDDTPHDPFSIHRASAAVFRPGGTDWNRAFMSNGNQHPAALDVEQLLKECEMRTVRRSGPGGQHRNKVETAVVLTHRPTGRTAEANERRSQADNRKVAVFRLRLKLALAERRLRVEDDSPSRLWADRCRGGRIAVNPGHDDFPALLAEALDFLASAEFDVGAAAERLGCTGSQLTKFLQREPGAFAWVNSRRSERGLHRLR